jgi:hypothetical protein
VPAFRPIWLRPWTEGSHPCAARVRWQGKYTAIINDVPNIPCGEVRSVNIKVQPNCTSDRKMCGKLEDSPIKHEYCVVFRKTAEALAHKEGGLPIEMPASSQ